MSPGRSYGDGEDNRDEEMLEAPRATDRNLELGLMEVQPETEPLRRRSKEEYEMAVVNAYDKAATSEDWVILQSVKAHAGSMWLDVCALASDKLDAGMAFPVAFQEAFKECGIVP